MLETILALGFGLLVVVTAIIFVPAVIAFMRGHAYKWIILVLCFATYITGVTWIVALVWAVWPANKSLADPVLGNVTGTGQRNTGDTLGSVQYGTDRGREQERVLSEPIIAPKSPVTVAPAPKSTVVSDTRECPHCAEVIKAAAKLCRFCGSTVEPTVAKASDENSWVDLVEPKSTPVPEAPVQKKTEPEPRVEFKAERVTSSTTSSADERKTQMLWGAVCLVIVGFLAMMMYNTSSVSSVKKTTATPTPVAANKTPVTLPSGNKYVGDMVNGVPNGSGVLTTPDGLREWKGTFVNGQLNGKVSFVNKSDGSTYTGDFVNDKPSGQGAWTYKDGAKFVGWFENGRRNGFGTYTYADGTKWSGMYKDGKAVK